MCAVHGEQVGDCLPLCRFGQLELGKQHDRVVCNLFPSPPSRVEGRNGEGCKTNRRPATTGNFVIDVAQLQQRTLAPSQAKPRQVESRLVQDEDEDETASVAEVVANEVHANPAQSLRLDLALIFG